MPASCHPRTRVPAAPPALRPTLGNRRIPPPNGRIVLHNFTGAIECSRIDGDLRRSMPGELTGCRSTRALTFSALSERNAGTMSILIFVAGAALLIYSAEKLITYLVGAAAGLHISLFLLAIVFTGIE